jgi:CheY-like chemotaxis protein
MKKNTCLLIDDDPDDRDIFAMVLESADASYDCVTAKNGIAALELLNSNADFIPDFIFIDLNMPYMSGKETLQEIKRIERISRIPAIIYTTSSYERDVEETKQLGASYFLVKPPSMSRLTKTLSDILNNRELPYYLSNE